MSVRRDALPLRRRPVQKWLGVWGVPDYYTLLDHQAEEGAEFTLGYFLLVTTAACLAVGGLLLNNPVIIIGAMCVAPFLGPSRAVCIGGIFGRARIFWCGLVKQLIGLLFIGLSVAFLLTTVLLATVPGIQMTDEILARSMPTTQETVLTILVAIAAGAAASLSLSAEPRVVSTPLQQLIDTMIGVEIAISLMPPAAAMGIGLAFHQPALTARAALLLAVNVLAIDIVGSMMVLALRGVRRRWLVLEAHIREIVDVAIDTVSPGDVMESSASVTLLSPDEARLHVTVRNYTDEDMPDDFASMLAARIQEESGSNADVLVEEILCQRYSSL